MPHAFNPCPRIRGKASWMIGFIVLVICLSVFLPGVLKHKRGIWVTLAKTRTADGGYYFVRQMGDPFPFCEVGFGFISKSGIQYSHYLDHEGFPWRRVQLVERDGNIHVLKNGLNVAVFNPEGGHFTNQIVKRTFDEQEGLSGGYGSTFFKIEPE